MTRAFYLILAPALLILLLYLSIGIRPPVRALIGMVLFAGLAWFLFMRKKKPRAAPPTLPPGALIK